MYSSHRHYTPPPTHPWRAWVLGATICAGIATLGAIYVTDILNALAVLLIVFVLSLPILLPGCLFFGILRWMYKIERYVDRKDS